MSSESENPEVIVAVPADSVVAELPEPVRITNPDGSGMTIHGIAAWDAASGDDGPDDECDGAP